MPKTNQVKFCDLEIGDAFLWGGHKTIKTEYEYRPRYGHTNCRFETFRAYDGDTGYRFRHDSDLVTFVEE